MNRTRTLQNPDWSGQKTKVVSVTVMLRLLDDQPVVDWLPDVIGEQLMPVYGEEIVSYSDDEPVSPTGAMSRD